MKLATIDNGQPDGALVVVSPEGARARLAAPIAATLQEALERWNAVAGDLQALARDADWGDPATTVPFDPAAALAPLPRAWQWLDGSAFNSHQKLMARVFNLPKLFLERPLMYQGMSHRFYGPTADVPLPDEADGIDFEGEFGVIVDETPMGVSAEAAERHIRLVVQVNDWSLRSVAPREMETGFGWIQAKPACSVAPLAVTPDELGPAWRDGRVALPLEVQLNGRPFGKPGGEEMSFSFPELIAHAARTRSLCAGTLIGSGTVSNEDHEAVGSACIAERRGIEMLRDGAPSTPFMRFGDMVRMEARTADGALLFGAIEQRVVPA